MLQVVVSGRRKRGAGYLWIFLDIFVGMLLGLLKRGEKDESGLKEGSFCDPKMRRETYSTDFTLILFLKK